MKILGRLITQEDVTAALNRIADVADPDDVNLIRAELARLRRVLDAGDDEDLPYMGPLSVTHYTMKVDELGGTTWEPSA